MTRLLCGHLYRQAELQFTGIKFQDFNWMLDICVLLDNRAS